MNCKVVQIIVLVTTILTALPWAPLLAEDYPVYIAPEVPPENIFPGVIKRTEFNQSKLFPGTKREVTVFLPAQYDKAKPACVYVKTDGCNPREKELIETMIAKGEMPVTVGVFVRPGELPAPMAGTLGRRNWDLEYDGVDDKNVRFFHEELLPFVAKDSILICLSMAMIAAYPEEVAEGLLRSPLRGIDLSGSVGFMPRAEVGSPFEVGMSFR